MADTIRNREQEFQSTPPIRGATVMYTLLPVVAVFQSTPPGWGATHLIQIHVLPLHISIHAPHAGGDCNAAPG